jgi:hypothetical protein
VYFSRKLFRKNIKKKAKPIINRLRRNISVSTVEEKHCIICNFLIRENEWNNHIKSRFHKKIENCLEKILKRKQNQL